MMLLNNSEHEKDVSQMFKDVAKLLAQPASHMLLELCELRNMLLTGNLSQFKFVTSKQLKPPATSSSSSQAASLLALRGAGFFADYGKPESAIVDTKIVTFWSDEWRNEIGAEKAVGHFISIFMEKNRCWRDGQIVGYDADTDKHQIQLDPSTFDLNMSSSSTTLPASASIDAAERITERSAGTIAVTTGSDPSVGIKEGTGEAAVSKTTTTTTTKQQQQPEIISINIDDLCHKWIDSYHKQRLEANTTSRGDHGDSGDRTTPALTVYLSFTQRDVGLFVRIWWSRYQRFFYGRVLAYDSTSKEHRVVYEDGDSRMYDMSTKTYEIIDVHQASSGALSLVNATSDAECAQLVSAWHRKELAKSKEGDEKARQQQQLQLQKQQQNGADLSMTLAASSSSSGTSAVQSLSQLLADGPASLRPPAIGGSGTSLHHIAVIDTYFKNNGGETMFRGLFDAQFPSPGCKIIALHLQLVYQLRKVLHVPVVRSLIWEAKEAVPRALARYGDLQFKEFTINDFQEVLAVLRELLSSTIGGGGTVSTINSNTGRGGVGTGTGTIAVDESLELLRLSVASKMLTCCQLQKRYVGLSMIKEAIEAAYPMAATFVVKRSLVMSVARGGQADSYQPLPLQNKSCVLGPQSIETWLLDNGRMIPLNPPSQPTLSTYPHSHPLNLPLHTLPSFPLY